MSKDLDKILTEAGYKYLPYEGPSGRPRFSKDFHNGIIFFFPEYKIVNNSPFVGLLIRKIKGRWLETVHENTFNIMAIDNEQVKYIEYLFHVL